MPLSNVIQQHITAVNMTAANTALSTLEAVITTFARNLTPEEKVQYGSINELNKNLVNKVRDYRASNPGMSSPDIDWVEFEADWQDRQNIGLLLNRLNSIAEMLNDTKTLHDYDNYNAALRDHSYTKYKKETDGGGYDAKYDELKQFFPNG